MDRWLGRLLGVLFAFGAAFHAAHVVVPSMRDNAVPERHLAFMLINLAAAIGLITRTRSRGFALAFVVLLCQQLASHGGDAWRMWQAQGRVDRPDVAILVVVAIATLLVLVRAFRSPADVG
jgi:predicted MFS family arabinose efflux permease